MLTATSTCTQSKSSVFLTAGWHNLVMLNFPINPAVLEPLVLTGKPWKNAAPTFAAPMPIISPFPSTS